MKKLTVLFCLLALLCSLAAVPEASAKFTRIDISADSVKFRDALFQKFNIIGQTREQQLHAFNTKALPVLRARQGQAFPNVPTKNRLDKEVFAYGDVYTLSGESEDCLVLYIHGGAWVWEINERHVQFCDRLVDGLNAKVYMPIYPLAPQATYREGYRMLEQVYGELLKKNKPIIVMGDSAGGTLTLGLVLRQKAAGNRLPSKVVVLAPGAEATLSNPEIDKIALRDGMLPKYECAACARLWAGGEENLRLPDMSPINGDFRGFPPTLMFIGTYDILSADDLRLYKKLRRARVDVSLVEGNGFWHVFPIFAIKEKEQCLQIIKEFCTKNRK